MRSFIFTIVALVALARPGAAQIVEKDSIVDFEQSLISETSLFISSFGLNFADNLQQLLSSNGFSGAPTAFRQTANFGLYYRWAKVKLGFSLGFDLPSSLNDNNLRLRTQRYNGLFRLGYGVFNTRNRRFFANVGLGAMGWEAYLFSAGPATAATNWANLRPTSLPRLPSVFLTNTQPVIDVSFEVLLREHKHREARLNYRVGYMVGLKPQAWQAEGLILPDAPTDRFHRFYIDINFAFVRSYRPR